MTTVTYTRRFRLRNPVTGEVKLVSGSEATRLKRYGWVKATLDEWFAYKCTTIDYNAKVSLGQIVRH